MAGDISIRAFSEKKATKLEDLKEGAPVEGLTPSGTATVVKIEWFGDQAVKVVFEDGYTLASHVPNAAEPPKQSRGRYAEADISASLAAR